MPPSPMPPAPPEPLAPPVPLVEEVVEELALSPPAPDVLVAPEPVVSPSVTESPSAHPIATTKSPVASAATEANKGASFMFGLSPRGRPKGSPVGAGARLPRSLI